MIMASILTLTHDNGLDISMDLNPGDPRVCVCVCNYDILGVGTKELWIRLKHFCH
jgi:hypothetical protein